MTYDSKNYSGPGAAGAVLLPGRNAAGAPPSVGPGAQGVDNPPVDTLPADDLIAYVTRLSADPSAKAGPTNLFQTYNGTINATTAYLTAVAALQNQGVTLVEPNVLLP